MFDKVYSEQCCRWSAMPKMDVEIQDGTCAARRILTQLQ